MAEDAITQDSSAGNQESARPVPFLFRNHSIRVVAENDRPWFIAKDVAKALGIGWTGHTLDNIPNDWKGMVNLTTSSSGRRGGGEQNLIIISEPAVYKLAFRSNKPEADAFTNWVASEILPSIRKTGQYAIADSGRPALPVSKHSAHLVQMAKDCWVLSSVISKFKGGRVDPDAELRKRFKLKSHEDLERAALDLAPRMLDVILSEIRMDLVKAKGDMEFGPAESHPEKPAKKSQPQLPLPTDNERITPEMLMLVSECWKEVVGLLGLYDPKGEKGAKERLLLTGKVRIVNASDSIEVTPRAKYAETMMTLLSGIREQLAAKGATYSRIRSFGRLCEELRSVAEVLNSTQRTAGIMTTRLDEIRRQTLREFGFEDGDVGYQRSGLLG